MSSIAAAVFEAIVGILVTKSRNVAAVKVEDDDVIDHYIRNLIVREINDIKSMDWQEKIF